ncbi:thioesterase domain-containing protein [Actinoalloteichus caeruleus]|uniref:Thioesterase domain-containing protein n=1 Tax=Actinoalloteichus caeruleus DSM 43889 TaxID=1120930 RepID=A0ABT1JDH7_ACTCY|nr:alpha/beta fold hydrolase [Actinoalloteichus caeruleus]MCP2330557.1 Thioesterase domain-containing protein [Actinoalloteichus caeruleus DSM 43889]
MPDLERLVPLRTGGHLPPVFCVHAVSGSAYAYAGLARLLGDDRPVHGFEAPGFDNDRTPVGSLTALADEYTDILRAAHPDGTYLLLGWSLGGLVAFEMAKRLTQAGDVVDLLVLVDAGLPRVMDLPPERDILVRFVRDMAGTSGESPAGLDELAATWAPDVAPGAVFEEVERAGVLPEEFDSHLLGEQYAVFRAHLKAFYSIEVTGSHPGPAVHVLAEASPAQDMRWQRFLPDLVEHTVPHSTHHSIWTGDSLLELSRLVREHLGH